MRAIPIAAVLAAVLALAGCNTTENTERPAADPARLVRVLPTPDGLSDARLVEDADAAAVQAALSGRSDAGDAGELAGALQEGAVREWAGPGGRELVVVATVWDDHMTAANVTAGAAELPLREVPGARAWTPRDLSSSRGARAGDADDGLRTLSLAVGPNGLYVRSAGLPEDVAVTTMRRLAQVLRGTAADPED